MREYFIYTTNLTNRDFILGIVFITENKRALKRYYHRQCTSFYLFFFFFEELRDFKGWIKLPRCRELFRKKKKKFRHFTYVSYKFHEYTYALRTVCVCSSTLLTHTFGIYLTLLATMNHPPLLPAVVYSGFNR